MSEATPPRQGLLLRIIKDQRVAFLLVGAVNTGIGFLLFVLFDLTLGRSIIPAVGAPTASIVTLVCAYVTASIFAFVLHRTLVFRVRGHLTRDFLRYQTVNLVPFLANLLVLPLLVLAGVPTLLAQLLFTVVNVVVSWFGHKYFSFRRGKPAVEPAEPVETVDDAEREGR